MKIKTGKPARLDFPQCVLAAQTLGQLKGTVECLVSSSLPEAERAAQRIGWPEVVTAIPEDDEYDAEAWRQLLIATCRRAIEVLTEGVKS